MKAVWTPTGGVAATLGADWQDRKWIKLEQLGGAGLEQVEPLYDSDVVFREMRGNLAGDCVFTVKKSHATRDAAALYFVSEFARIGQGGQLELTFDAATLKMVNATFKSVVVADPDGLAWTLRYSFGISTIVTE